MAIKKIKSGNNYNNKGGVVLGTRLGSAVSIPGVYSADSIQHTRKASLNKSAEKVSAIATILSGQSTSDAIEILGDTKTIHGILFPAAFTGATVTFTGSNDGSTYTTVKAIGGASNYSITVTTSSYIVIDPDTFRGLKYIKVVSASSEGGNRTITLMMG